MGTCIHCNKEITLRDKEELCPNCNLVPFKCWECQSEIPTDCKICDVCGWYICKSCGACSKNCRIKEICFDIKDKLEIKEFKKTLPNIVRYVFYIKSGKKHMVCPDGVPITYAKTLIESIIKKTKGIGTKSELDINAFEQRMQVIINKPIGSTWKINDIRKNGEEGNEFRKLSNAGVCFGKVKVEHIIEKIEIKGKRKTLYKIKKYDLYTRYETNSCQYMKNIDENNIKKSSVDWCQLNRNKFGVKNE